MLHRFGTYEEAALFVSLKRDQGYYAQILHEHVSVLWGPLATGGVAAWVSECAAEDGDEVADMQIRVPSLPKELSLVASQVVLAVIALCLVPVVLAMVRYLAYDTRFALMVFGCLLLIVALMVALVSICGWLGSKWVHAVWSPQSRFHMTATAIHVVLAVVLLVCCTEVGDLLFNLLFYLYGV